jgi:hypothetical protein
MADGLKSTCVVWDPTGQHCNVSMSFEPGIFGQWFDKSGELAELIKAHSVGMVVKRSDTYSTPVDKYVPGNVIGKYGTIDQKIIVILRENWTGKTRKMEIPAPKDNIFKQVEEKGFRLLLPNGLDIAARVSAMLPAGKDVSFVRGWLKGKQ